jgi:hypothetical protein
VTLHVVNVTWTDLRALACICHFWSQSWIARRWVWSFWEATAGSLSVARTAVSSANVAMVVVGEVGRSAVCRRYSSGPRMLPWGMPAWIGDREWSVEAMVTEKCLLCKYDWRGRDSLNLYKSPVCQTLPKAWEMSRNAAKQYALCSKAS